MFTLGSKVIYLFLYSDNKTVIDTVNTTRTSIPTFFEVIKHIEIELSSQKLKLISNEVILRR